MRTTIIIATLLAILMPLQVQAQDDTAAGLFTKARQLPLLTQAIRIDVAGDEAELQLSQIFVNNGDDIGQADYHLYLPEGATLVGFGFWQGDTFHAAELKERGEAEAAHRTAAASGRTTGLVKKERSIHTLSVYPVRANEHKRVDVTLRLPVAMEMGRKHVQVPIDTFLGSPAASSTVLVEIQTMQALAGFGVDGARPTVLEKSRHHARLALASRHGIDLWWHEEMPPLSTSAQAVELDEGGYGVVVRAALYDGGEWRAPYDVLHLLVDTSFSMRRRDQSLLLLLDRILAQSPVPVRVHGVSEQVQELTTDGVTASLVRDLLRGKLGHGSQVQTFVQLAADIGCDAEQVRCAAITDAQLPDVQELTRAELPVLLLADPHEAAHMADRIPDGALLFQTESDPAATLLGLADQLVLPVLMVEALTQAGDGLQLVGRQALKVAEGGMLRLIARTDQLLPITLHGRIAGRPVERSVTPTIIDVATAVGEADRRAVYSRVLADWMDRYRQAPDGELRAEIVRVSMRESIPTAFTALQVDAPELSLYATKPGDPLLTVHPEPGLVDVTAWYPFGDMRRLALDTTSGRFTDRFLVPRGWKNRAYRIEIFKHFKDGSVQQAAAWYLIDELGPRAQLLHDAARNELRIESDEASMIGAVAVHTADGQVLTLTPVQSAWSVPLADLPSRFSVVLRDRAGNRTVLRCEHKDGALDVQAAKRPRPSGSRVPRTALPMTLAGGNGMGLIDGRVHLAHAGRELHFDSAGLGLRSVELSAKLELDDGQLLIGTRGGDLLRLSCATRGACEARVVTARFVQHPISGLARLGAKRVLIGVLGQGLHEMHGERLRVSRIKVGSRFITAVQPHVDGVLIGTAYNGLWRVRGKRARREAFPHQHVAAIETSRAGTEIVSGHGRFLRQRRNRYQRLDSALAELSTGAPDLTDAVALNGQTYVAGFDSGLWTLEHGRLVAVNLGLSPQQRRINAIEAHAGQLWLGTEDGLLLLDPSSCGVTHVLLQGRAVHDSSSGAPGLAIASAAGVHVLSGRSLERWDFQRPGASARYMSVAFWGDRLYAGSLEGLSWFDGDTGGYITVEQGLNAGWITSLLPDRDRLLIGTYDQGVFTYDGATAAQLTGSEAQWVPPLGLSRVGANIWIGGTGMAPMRMSDGDLTATPVPARDVSQVFDDGGVVRMLSSQGLVSASRRDSPALASR